MYRGPLFDLLDPGATVYAKNRERDIDQGSLRWPGLIGGRLGHFLLNTIGGNRDRLGAPTVYMGRSKLETLLGAEIWTLIRDKAVLDFGCGDGGDAVAMAKHGARRVIGLDIRENILNAARLTANQEGVQDRCVFTTTTTEKVDVVVSMDGFEHYADPMGVLHTMRALLREDGVALVSFGPPWFHPLGGHLFSVFPWAHLLFTERSLIRWRSQFKSDGARRFSEVAGGLNQMTIRRFERLLRHSDFSVGTFEAVPIRQARLFHGVLTREFLTAVVRCRLRPRASSAQYAAEPARVGVA
ncbi:MAG: hypothetical protein DMD81_11160 [Candidatus Rokuibacteriota bacterium]|nr:MAG: hypothetical protein DMD81_11160 [Candidatus Rokubacteria bacterium]